MNPQDPQLPQPTPQAGQPYPPSQTPPAALNNGPILPQAGAPAAPRPAIEPSYDFIMDPSKGSAHLGAKPSTGVRSRLLIAAGGGIIVIIALLIGVKLFSKPSPLTPVLTAVAKQQQELIHLTGDDLNNNNESQYLSSTHSDFAITVNASVTSSQSQMLSYMQSNGVDIDTKILAQTFNSSLDDQLTTAVSAGNFDSVFTSLVAQQLKAYQTALQQAYNTVQGPVGRGLLQDDFQQTQLLLTQLASTNS
ncbi:MAG TPA: hypothetical protein VG992_01820 [Candidatus Saccharimonadales bacterium]|nr:hypothetical protein [Candidatus Saccharimonadales bacterium]